MTTKGKKLYSQDEIATLRAESFRDGRDYGSKTALANATQLTGEARTAALRVLANIGEQAANLARIAESISKALLSERNQL